MYETLEIARDGGVATLDEPPGCAQRLQRAAHRRTHRGLPQLDADDTVRVVVLAGRGKSFSAGADLNWMKRAGNASVEENLADARKLAGMLRTWPR
jgi:methylglutaconyl-CoA hydratase